MHKLLDTSLVLLTYNDKILLMLHDNRPDISHTPTWCFIGGNSKNNESVEKSILREIEEKTNLHLISVTLLTTLQFEDKEKYIYHAYLTTDNLNNIKRGENQSLDFFTLREVEKLPLADTTKLFLANHKDTIEKILQN